MIGLIACKYVYGVSVYAGIRVCGYDAGVSMCVPIRVRVLKTLRGFRFYLFQPCPSLLFLPE